MAYATSDLTAKCGVDYEVAEDEHPKHVTTSDAGEHCPWGGSLASGSVASPRRLSEFTLLFRRERLHEN